MAPLMRHVVRGHRVAPPAAPTCWSRPARRAHAGREPAAESSTPAARQADRTSGWSASDLHHREDGAVLQERQLAGAEVVEQRTETARAAPRPAGAIASRDRGRTRDLGRRAPARGRSRSVDPAHPVDGHLFDQRLGDELGLGVRSRWFGSMTLPFVRRGSTTSGRCGQNRQSEYGIECRNGRVGSDGAAAVAGGPAPLHDARNTSPTSPSSCSPPAGSTEVSVDDVAQAAGHRPPHACSATTRRRTPFRGATSTLTCSTCRNCSTTSIRECRSARRCATALLAFNTFDESETVRHRQRMRVILQTAELQAYSMTMYAGWREVIAGLRGPPDPVPRPPTCGRRPSPGRCSGSR